MALTLFLTITSQQGAKVSLEISEDTTPSELRKKASESTNIPTGSLRLIFRGRMIKDDESTSAVQEYKLEKDCVVHCMGKPEAPVATPAASAAAPSVAASVPMQGVSAGPSVSVAARPAASASATASSAVSLNADPLQAAIGKLRNSNPPPVAATALETLGKILNNITSNPMEAKYRKVKKQNAAFQRRLGGVVGGDDAMIAVGFVSETQDGEDVYFMHASADAWPKLVASKEKVESAARNAKLAVNQPSSAVPPPVVPNAAAMPGGMPGLGGMMGAGAGLDPNMQSAVANMMSNPEALQAMMQNPMIQQMIRNDPNIPPGMRQTVEQMTSNPAMMEQMSRMMANPAMRSRFENMMANRGGMGGGMGGPFGGGAGVPPANAQVNTNNSNSNSNGGDSQNQNDEDQTEEEMIAEAIRRSLAEG